MSHSDNSIVDISSKVLIPIVKEKSIIWDPKNPKYRDRVHRDEAWQEIYTAIEPNFQTLSKVNKIVLGNAITKKWYNLRDSHTRSRKQKSRFKRPYINSEMLSFLDTDSHENNSDEEYDNFSEFKNVGDSNSMADVEDGANSKDNMFIDVDEDMCEPLTKRVKRENDSLPELPKQRNSSSIVELCKGKLIIADLIEMIEKKRLLWDKTCLDYVDTEKRDKAWKELYRSFEPKFEELHESEQNKIGDYITKKWYNVKDAYVKSLKNPKRKRPYLYAEKLKFLEPHFSDRNSSVIEYYETNEFQDGDESHSVGDSDDECHKVIDGVDDFIKSNSKKLKIKSSTSSSTSHVVNKMVSTQKLIRIIKNKRLLWDRTCSNYKHKEKREKAWRDVYKVIIPNFDKLTKTAQHEIGIQITKKWINIRDTYVKSLKNAGIKRPYIHSEWLTFLDAQYQNNSDSECNNSIEFKTIDDDNNSVEDIAVSNLHFQEEVFLKVDKHIFKTVNENCELENASEEEGNYNNKIKTNTEDKLLSVLEKLLEREEDEERSFFNAILSSVKSLSDDSKIEFRMSVLKLIQTLKKKDAENVDTIS